MDIRNFYLTLSLAMDLDPVMDFFKEKSISSILYFHCNNGSIVGHRKLNDNNMHVASFDIRKVYVRDLPYTHNRIGLLLDASCKNWSLAFHDFMENKPFKDPFIWLIYSEDKWSTAKTLADYRIEIDSDVTIFSKVSDTYTFYEVYHRNYFYDNILVNYMGYWNKQLHLEKNKMRDLSGLTFRCNVVVTVKIVNKTFEEYLRTAEPRNGDSLHKLKFVTLLHYIRDMYNVSLHFQRTNSWGYFRNGTFDGLVGSLLRNEADIGGTPLFFRGDRAQVIDYIAESWVSKQYFILRHPKHPGGYNTIFTRPLSAKVWLCMTVLVVLSAVILTVMLNIKAPIPGEGPIDASFSLGLLFAFSAICQQGMTIGRKSIAVRMLVFVIFIFALTLYQYYNATVVSTLLREPPKNIRTLQDLVRSHLKAGAEDVLYAKDFFKRTTDPVALEMYHKKIIPEGQNNFLTPERGMALVKRGGYAFHVDSVVAYRIMRRTFTERQVCEAHEVPLYPPQKMGLVVRKGSPYKEHFTFAIRKFWETGLMNRLLSVWDEPRPPCVHTPDSSIFSVSIVEFSSALWALIVGMFVSIMVLAGEIVVHRFTKKPIVYKH